MEIHAPKKHRRRSQAKTKTLPRVWQGIPLLPLDLPDLQDLGYFHLNTVDIIDQPVRSDIDEDKYDKIRTRLENVKGTVIWTLSGEIQLPGLIAKLELILSRLHQDRFHLTSYKHHLVNIYQTILESKEYDPEYLTWNVKATKSYLNLMQEWRAYLAWAKDKKFQEASKGLPKEGFTL